MIRSSFGLAALAAFGLVPACTQSADHAAESEVALTNAAPIVFQPCAMAPGAPAASAECATIPVPLDWSKPEGRRIDFFVKRIRGSAPGPHKQLWLLQGGPGAPGEGFDYQARTFQGLDPAFDLYIPDHRGTGRSSILECPNAMASGFEACLSELVGSWGREGLAQFSTTAAARDVGNVIARTREPGQIVHVYGISYGTYIAQRYLQIFPTQPSSVTLDGVCQAGLCSMLKYNYWSDSVAQKFMRECGADAFCASKLGPDPNARVREAAEALDSGRCNAVPGFTGARFKGTLLNLTRSLGLRNVVPALTYRVLRCDEGDKAVLQNFVRVMSPPPPPVAPPAAEPVRAEQARFSQLLSFNIAFSEMMETPAITREGLQELMSSSVFVSYNPYMHDAFDAFPRYDHDEHVGRYPQTEVPVLLLNGTLDSATPIEFAEEVAAHYTRPHQTLVTFPRAPHGTLNGSWMPSAAGGSSASCALEVFQQFLADPTRALDTSCTSRIYAHGFEGAPGYAQRFFGTPDLWENIAPVVDNRGARDEEIDAELRRLENPAGPFFSTR